RIRAPGAGRAAAPDARPHHAGGRAPSLDHRARRPGAGLRPGPHGGAGHPRRAACARRPVRPPARHAVPRGRHGMSGREAPKWWYEPGARVPLWARAVAPLYAAVVALRVRLYGMGLLRSHALKLPVLVVGNLVAGGSGKTPLTIAIVERLRAEGWNPGVASRGYGRA